jgi:hypothetical protein
VNVSAVSLFVFTECPLRGGPPGRRAWEREG